MTEMQQVLLFYGIAGIVVGLEFTILLGVSTYLLKKDDKK